VKKKLILGILLISFCFSFNTQAYNSSYTYIKEFKPGSYAVYKFYRDNEEQSIYKTSILKKEANNNYWVEYSFKNLKTGEKNIIKMLINLNNNEIKKFIIQNGTDDAKELPVSMVKMMGGEVFLENFNKYMDYKYKLENYEDKNIIIKTRKNVSIKTPAGKFKCKYIKSVEKKKKYVSELYISNKVPGGLVKLIENNEDGKTKIILIKYKSKGAKSEIKGSIKKLNIPAGLPFSK